MSPTILARSSSSQEYTVVPTTTKEDGGRNEGSSKKYFLRQLFVASAMWTPFFTAGLALGTPTVYIPQYRREQNSTEAVSVEMASWLSSSFAYASFPWCLILAFLTSYIGRKKTFIIVALTQILWATTFYFSITPTHILITEIMYGLIHASAMNVCIIALVEYTSPGNRGMLLTIKSATVYWSLWAANAIGTFTSWKYISILGFANAFYSLTALFWPESPTWLACQGRYEECRRSYRWLRGSSENSEKELEMMINKQMEARKIVQIRNFRNTFKFLAQKEFWYPVGVCFLVCALYQLSGKQVVTLYAIDIVKQITSSESTAYKSMLILDGVSVFAMYVGCFLSKVLKRRSLLFFFGSLAVFFLLSISLYLYLVHLGYLFENKYISITLLVGFSVSIGLGPIILSTSLFAELIPLRYKAQATVLIAWSFVIPQAIILKNSPLLFKVFNIHGTFLCYGISVTVCLVLLYKYLPETKDKSLEEIEQHFKD